MFKSKLSCWFCFVLFCFRVNTKLQQACLIYAAAEYQSILLFRELLVYT